MKNYDNLNRGGFTEATPIGLAMVKAAYNMGYDFFPNLYREKVQTTLHKTDVELLMDNIRFYLIDDDFTVLQEFSGVQVCPSFFDDDTAFLLRSLGNDPISETTVLSNECYSALDKGVIDGYMDTMRDIINGMKPIGSYALCNGVAIEVYHIDHARNEVLANLVAANTIEDPDKLYPPSWCKVCEGDDPESENGRGQGFLYGRVFVPFSRVIGLRL